MSASDGTCEYVLDPNDPPTWGRNEEGDDLSGLVSQAQINDDSNGNEVWACPHDCHDEIAGERRCIFHLPASHKEMSKVEDAFHERIESVDAGSKSTEHHDELQFLGAELADVRIDSLERQLPENVNIGLNYARIDGNVVLNNMSKTESKAILVGAVIRGDINFATGDGEFSGLLNFDYCHVGGSIDFTDATIDGSVVFQNANIENDVDFSRASMERCDFLEARVGGDAYYSGANITEDVRFSFATVNGSIDFFQEYRPATIGSLKCANAVVGDIYLVSTTIKGDATFAAITVQGEIKLRHQNRSCNIDGVVDFSNASIEGDVSFVSPDYQGGLTLSEAEIRGDLLIGINEQSNARIGDDAEFEETEVYGDADLENFRCDGNINFRNSRFHEEVSFRQGKLSGADFYQARLTNTDFVGATLSNTNLERTILSRSTLFQTKLSGAKLYGAILGDVEVNTETVFDDHDEHRCIYDPNSAYEYDNETAEVGQLQKAMGTYQLLEQLTRANTLPDEQSMFFARRQDIRRAQLREEGDFPRFRYWFAEMQNMIFRHGESFSRIVAVSIGTILMLTIMYPFGGSIQTESGTTITYNAITESPIFLWKTFHHSALLFLTGTGPLDTTGTVGEVLTTIEAAVAPILLALIVFVLGRRAAR